MSTVISTAETTNLVRNLFGLSANREDLLWLSVAWLNDFLFFQAPWNLDLPYRTGKKN